jgi:DHA1 family bicyclomycin/chloramphenicol resistance-like MFS transporter
LIGFGIYFVAAIACALSPTVEWLIAMRLLLALGGCAGMVASRAIIRDSFERNDIARAFSSLILVMGVAPIIAPMLGGIILAEWGWRFIFWFLSFYAISIFLVTYFFLSESKKPDHSVSLNIKQVVLNYREVLKNRIFLIFGITGSFSIASLFTYISGSPFVVRELLGYSETEFGWLFGINAVGFITASQINRRLLKGSSPYQISRWVALFFVLMGLLMVWQSYNGISNQYLFLTSLFLFMSCLGFINPNMQAMALEPFAQNAGVASALVGSLRMVSGALASVLISVFHNDTSEPMAYIMAFCALIVVLLLWLGPLGAKRAATAA